MEVWLFCITMGLLMALCLVGIGVIVGEGVAKRDNRRVSECEHDPGVIYCRGSLDDSGVDILDKDRSLYGGNIDMPRIRQVGSTTPQERTMVLEYFRIGASQLERAVIDDLLAEIGGEEG